MAIIHANDKLHFLRWLIRQNPRKTLPKIANYARYAFGSNKDRLHYTPPGLGIAVTERCNLFCPDCYWLTPRIPNNKLKTADIALDDVIKVFARFGNNAVHCSFTGGEPLLHKDIFEMIRIAAAQPLYTSLFTNGVLLEQCSNAILTSGLSALNISAHTLEGNTQLAADPAALNTNKELSAIAYLSSQCASMHIRTSICVMITRKNYSSMKDIITIGEKLGVDVVRLMAILPSEAASPDTVGSWDDQEIRDFFIKDILPLRPSVDVVMPKFLKNRTRIKICQELFLYLKFSVSGDTYPCCYLPLVQSYGNVFSEDFDWNSDIYIAARAKMREGNKLTRQCILCPYSSSTNIQYNRLLRRWTGLIKFG